VHLPEGAARGGNPPAAASHLEVDPLPVEEPEQQPAAGDAADAERDAPASGGSLEAAPPKKNFEV